MRIYQAATDGKYTLIERTALEMAAVFYEAARSSGMTSEFPNARKFAKAKLEIFIAPALKALTEMLHRADVSEHMKLEIYEAIMERNNDPNINAVFGAPNIPNQFDYNLPDDVLKSLGLKRISHGQAVKV